ncbi:MAG: hypothetical protein ACXWX3_07260, partial [Actinomycetota bacterium]
AWNCGSPATWFAQTSSWVDTAPPLPATDTRPAYSFGSVTPAGSVVVVRQVESVLGEGGGPYLGSPDAPVHIWVWRPPSVPLVFSRVPNVDDANYLLSNFLDAWSRDIRPYIPVYATADVLAKFETATGGLDLFQVRPFRNWGVHPSATDLGGGRFEVRVTLTLKDGREPTVVFDIGPGTTADGREAQLVVTDVRLDES